MPEPDVIHESLRQIANDWRALAFFWHVYFGVLVLALVFGLRPTRKIVGVLLALPLLCVSVLAWIFANPFNGTFFALVTFTLLVLVKRFRPERCQLSAVWWARSTGAGLSVFGWIYPHFLDTSSFLPYLYAAPLGLVPCPALSMVIGISLLFGGLGSRTWSVILGVTGMFYGVFGAVLLGVTIDWVLTVGSVAILALAATDVVQGQPQK